MSENDGRASMRSADRWGSSVADRPIIDVATPAGGWGAPWPNVAEIEAVLRRHGISAVPAPPATTDKRAGFSAALAAVHCTRALPVGEVTQVADVGLTKMSDGPGALGHRHIYANSDVVVLTD